MKEPCMCGAADCPSCSPGPCPTCGRYPGQDAGECPFEGGPDCLDHAESLAEEAAEAAAWERGLDDCDRADFDDAVERHFDWVRNR